MLHCLLYWLCRSRTRKRRSESEWESAASVWWRELRFAPTAITRIIRMLARPMATMARAGSLAASLSAQGRGITAGDTDITVGPMLADLRDLAALWVAVRWGTVR